MNTSTFNKKSMWILLIGSGLSTFGIFVAVPLIALHAFQVFKLSAYEIGLLSGIWPATVFSFSFLCGMAADKWGYLLAIRFSLLINTMAFIILSNSQSVEFFVLGLFLFGVGKTFFDSSIRAAMTCVCPPQSREKYFRLRYLIQNTGCVIGPIVGTFAYGHIGGKAFVLTSLSYFTFFILTLSALRSKGFAGNTNHGSISFFHKLKIIRNNNLFFWILSGTLILMSFGAYESFMPVISAQAGGQMPSFGILVSLNAVVVILFQLIHLNHLKNVTLSKSVAIGFTLMALGFFLYAVGFKLYAMTFVATVVFSVGESFLFPCFEVYMDKIAPESQKALYFGAGEIKQIGFFLGPVLGGLLVEAGGRVLLFSVCGLWLILAAIALYRIKITALTPQKQL